MRTRLLAAPLAIELLLLVPPVACGQPAVFWLPNGTFLTGSRATAGDAAAGAILTNPHSPGTMFYKLYNTPVTDSSVIFLATRASNLKQPPPAAQMAGSAYVFCASSRNTGWRIVALPADVKQANQLVLQVVQAVLGLPDGNQPGPGPQPKEPAAAQSWKITDVYQSRLLPQGKGSIVELNPTKTKVRLATKECLFLVLSFSSDKGKDLQDFRLVDGDSDKQLRPLLWIDASRLKIVGNAADWSDNPTLKKVEDQEEVARFQRLVEGQTLPDPRAGLLIFAGDRKSLRNPLVVGHGSRQPCRKAE